MKRLFFFIHGLYYEDTLLMYGGFSTILKHKNYMNFAFNLGIMKACIDIEMATSE